MGSPEAQQALWDRYFPQLLQIARQKHAGERARLADEEDVVLSMFDSFFRAAQRNRFPDLRDREGLWRLLSRMTHRKAVDLVRHNRRQKRHVLGESAIPGNPRRSGSCGLAGVSGDDPTPAIAQLVTEQCRRLLHQLKPQLQATARRKLDGYTNREIAELHQCSVATIERQLRLIRRIWSEDSAE